MKTFFIAFILGVCAGTIGTRLYTSPETYEKLKLAKAELLGDASDGKANASTNEQTDDQENADDLPDPILPDPLAPTPPASPEEPQTKPAKPSSPEFDEDSAKLPEPKPQPTPTPAAEPPPEPSPQPLSPPDLPKTQTKPEPTPLPAPGETVQDGGLSKLAERTKDTLERGTDAAAAVAQKAAAKAQELKKEATPYIEEGIDLTIQTAIRAQYKIERRIPSDAIAITVENREVTLTGSVPNGEILQRAIEIAVETKGVTKVTPKLEIE